MKIHVSGLLSFYWELALIANSQGTARNKGLWSQLFQANGLQQACPVIIYFVILWIGAWSSARPVRASYQTLSGIEDNALLWCC